MERQRDGERERERKEEKRRRLSFSPSLCLPVPPSLCLSVPPSLRPSVPPSLRPSVPPSLCLSVSLSFCLSVFITGCGKIGEPLPPIPRAPLVVVELRVEQQGTQLILSFPFTRTPRSARLQRVDIYRLTESVRDPQGIAEESFSARAGVINAIPADQIPLNNSTITFSDALDLKTTSRDVRYRYAVRLINTSGTAADFSNYAVIEPLFDLALPPAGLQTRQREKEIEITWTAPTANENGASPANVAAYNLYRAGIRINPEPLTEPRFIDRDFQFGATYEYAVRALSYLPNNASLASAIESNPSESLTYSPKDAFPPAAPTSLTIASINSTVSLFWPLNAEPDVAGYNIYRAEDEKTPPDKWIRLNPQLHKTASFRDDRVEVGKLYFYQITAVDVYGNESARSITVSEVVSP